MKTPFGDYDKMYGSLNYRGRVVLDIGADYGTTAEYFIDQGAHSVFVSEKNPEFLADLEVFARDTQGVTLLPPIDNANVEAVFRIVEPDVVKVDCEGCERFLFVLDDADMGRPSQWVLETHSRELFDGLVNRFIHLGYTVKMVEPFSGNPESRYVKVWTATR